MANVWPTWLTGRISTENSGWATKWKNPAKSSNGNFSRLTQSPCNCCTNQIYNIKGNCRVWNNRKISFLIGLVQGRLRPYLICRHCPGRFRPTKLDICTLHFSLTARNSADPGQIFLHAAISLSLHIKISFGVVWSLREISKFGSYLAGIFHWQYFERLNVHS